MNPELVAFAVTSGLVLFAVAVAFIEEFVIVVGSDIGDAVDVPYTPAVAVTDGRPSANCS